MRLLCRKRVAAVLYIRKMTDAHQVSTINIERRPQKKGFFRACVWVEKKTNNIVSMDIFFVYM